MTTTIVLSEDQGKAVNFISMLDKIVLHTPQTTTVYILSV